MKPQRRPPIMENQNNASSQAKRIAPGLQIAGMILKAVRIHRRFAGSAHPHKIRRQATAQSLDMWNDVAPQIGGRRIAMKEHDRIAFSDIHIAHVCVQHAHPLSWVCINARNSRHMNCVVHVVLHGWSAHNYPFCPWA